MPGFLPVSRVVTLPSGGLIQEDFDLGPLMAMTISARTAYTFSNSVRETFFWWLTGSGTQAVRSVSSLQDASCALNLSDLDRDIFVSDSVTGSEVLAVRIAVVRWGADTLGLAPPEWPFGDDWLYSYTRIKITRWCRAWSDTYDLATESAKSVRDAFDRWREAYDTFDQLAAADLNLALAQGALVGFKAFRTITGLANLSNGLQDSLQAKYGEAAATAIMGGIDRAVDLIGAIGQL